MGIFLFAFSTQAEQRSSRLQPDPEASARLTADVCRSPRSTSLPPFTSQESTGWVGGATLTLKGVGRTKIQRKWDTHIEVLAPFT